MADPKNPGQFGNRPDTSEQASKGGQASGGKFGSPKGADPSQAGKEGSKREPVQAKRRGGERSHQNDNS